jgi:hypothetical protein
MTMFFTSALRVMAARGIDRLMRGSFDWER